MLTIIQTGVTSAITMGGSVFSAIFDTAGEGAAGAWSAVQDVIGLQIGMAVIGWTIVKAKSLIYGF